MENPPQNTERICRLCLTKCDSSQLIDSRTKNRLDLFLPNINLFVSEEPVICINCAEITKKFFDLKSKCLDARNYIISFIRDKNKAKMHLKDIYLSNTEIVNGIPEDHDLCGFCMCLVENSYAVSLDTKEGENMQLKAMLEMCLPELDLSIIEKPIICASCHSSLEDCYRFLTNCLIIEEKIKKYRESLKILSEKCLVDLTHVLQFTLRNKLANNEDGNTVDIIKEKKIWMDPENLDELFEDKKGNFIKTVVQKFDNVLFTSENVLTFKEGYKKVDIIKTEEDFCVEPVKEVVQDNENFAEMEEQKFLRRDDIEIKTDQHDISRLFESDVAIPSSNETSIHEVDTHLLQHTTSLDILMYHCDSCSFQTKYKWNLDTHNLIHKDSSEITLYHCEFCSYQTKYKGNLRKHILGHKTLNKKPTELTIYKCNSCSYQTNRKFVLERHNLIHRDSSEITMYQCESCSYQTREKSSLKMHSLVHKDSSEITMYKCDSCSFETKYKTYLTRHMLVHKDPSQITMYQCEFCSYQAKRKTYISRHMLTHKDHLETEIYQCESCPFQTKYKSSMEKHLVVHKDPSEITMYYCDSCSYHSKRKRDLNKHKSVHKDVSEIMIYQCEFCSFRTKYKSYLNKHLLTHKNPSIFTVYNCEFCSFQSKYKNNLKRHTVVHKESSELTIYQCFSCSYKSKYKDALEKHSLIHKDPSETTVCQCDSCSYQTKSKGNLKVHKSSSETRMYKCECCSFETKYKISLQKHRLTHKKLSE